MDLRSTVLPALLLLCVLVSSAVACGAGRGGIRRRGARKLTPLVYKQHVPNFSEKSLAASGLPEGTVDRKNERFRQLVPNYNPDILFKDEEGTGADRLMTQRCKEKLNTLAISVMNQWPGTRLRVTEGWDEDDHHTHQSLHYEGRAVDITTSDRDRKKYGMLARLAVESGFDWVYYESRSHIHASCKSEASHPSKSGGCFTADATVMTSEGRNKKLSEVEVGDELLSVTKSGDYVFSPVIMFLDRDPEERRQFYVIRTESGNSLTLTPTHLVYAASAGASDEFVEYEPVFAKDVEVGQSVLVRSDLGGALRASRVTHVEATVRRGVYAPLTAQGNLVVDRVLASCYAVVDSQAVAHAAFWPARVYSSLFGGGAEEESTLTGVHWYADMLYSVANAVMPNHLK